jgi:hypothetical protein
METGKCPDPGLLEHQRVARVMCCKRPPLSELVSRDSMLAYGVVRRKVRRVEGTRRTLGTKERCPRIPEHPRDNRARMDRSVDQRPTKFGARSPGLFEAGKEHGVYSLDWEETKHLLA